jgi:hypothetical protein
MLRHVKETWLANTWHRAPAPRTLLNLLTVGTSDMLHDSRQAETNTSGRTCRGLSAYYRAYRLECRSIRLEFYFPKVA